MRDKYTLLIDAMDGVVWEVVPGTTRIQAMGDNVFSLLGYEPHAWTDDEQFWLDHTCNDDKERVAAFFRDPVAHDGKVLDCKFISADERIVCVTNYITIVYKDGVPVSLFGVMIDVTQKRMLEQLERLEKKVLELNATTNVSIEEVLQTYLGGIEYIFRKMRCSILRVHDGRAYKWVSLSLPEAYNNAVDGLVIGPNAGSCGTAAYLRERVIVSDIEHDERWVAFRDIALQSGLRACWSDPILATDGRVIATFAVYYDEVKVPNENELTCIDRAAAILKVILENRMYARRVEELHRMAMQGETLANFGTWQYEFGEKAAKCSETLCKIYGVDPLLFEPTYEDYLAMIHPEDRVRVEGILQKAHMEGGEEIFEQRILRADGAVRYLRSWFKAVQDEQGNPLRYYGASMDITREKEHAKVMAQIAWQQSHVVRAPLARIMGIVNLISEEVVVDREEELNLLTRIAESANELDRVIKDITYKTKIEE